LEKIEPGALEIFSERGKNAKILRLHAIEHAPSQKFLNQATKSKLLTKCHRNTSGRIENKRLLYGRQKSS